MSGMQERIVELIPRLRRYAQALTGNRSRAEDLVQDTLERSWSRRHLWRPGTDLRAWLFTIMHNVHINQVRRREPFALEDHPDPAIPASQEDGLALRDLQRALDRLPPEYREVLLLVAVEQMRYEEVARVLSLPMGTVMSRLFRARERLRALMTGSSAPVLRRIK